MFELLTEIVDRWILIFAVLSVAFTEALMQTTSAKITRWKFAVLCTAVVALLMSVGYSFTQADVTWQDGIARGIISAVIAIVAYDTLKTIARTLPFVNKNNKGGESDVDEG